MLADVDGRSQSEVWSDFLSHFPKNCNTCRGEDKGEDTTIILPVGLDIETALEKLGRLRGERFFLIINHFYFRGLYRKKSKKEEGNFLPIHRDTLVEIGGNRYLQLLKHGMSEGYVIKSPKSYLPDERSNEYRLCAALLDFRRQQTYNLTSAAAIRIWRERAVKRRQEFVRNSVARTKIAKSVDGLRFDYTSSFDFVSKITDSNQQSHRVAVLAQLITDGQAWAVDKQGRNYTTIVGIPSELRRFFTYLGEALCVIDISSSQPLLHSLLYEDDEPEKEKYLKALNGGFWDSLFVSASLTAQVSVYSYSDGATGSDFVTVSGSTTTFTTPVSVVASGTSRGFQISVNPTALQLGYDVITLTTSAPAALVQTQEITPGFGEPAETFTATININALSISLANINGVNAFSLTAGSDGIYRIDGAENWTGGESGFRGFLGLSATITGTISGSWSIQGPTETASGTFNQSVEFLNSYNHLPALIDTSSFPSSLSFATIESGGFFTRSDSFDLYLSALTPDFISETVDGVAITTGLSEIKMSLGGQGYSLSQGALSSVPEPSTYAAILGVVAIGLVAYRQRRRAA